jgi:heptosyltransferase-1
MSGTGKPAERILVVRLGAMGDVIHTLPAVAALKQNHPNAQLVWLVEPQWMALLEGNPYVDRVITVQRKSFRELFATWRELRALGCDFAVDFQGLIKSAVPAAVAAPGRVYGFHESQLRERAAGMFYSRKIASESPHVVDRNLELALASGRGAESGERVFPLPQACAGGELPQGDFVLACPLAGWRSKQWPMEFYEALAKRLKQELGVPLVLNGPPESALPHRSGLPGLIYATRRAAAVVGVDSGPMHLAAALGKPGVAIFGPTDPTRNGPYGNSMQVLRAPGATTTYKRGSEIDESMRQVTPDQVFASLLAGRLAR